MSASVSYRFAHATDSVILAELFARSTENVPGSVDQIQSQFGLRQLGLLSPGLSDFSKACTWERLLDTQRSADDTPFLSVLAVAASGEVMGVSWGWSRCQSAHLVALPYPNQSTAVLGGLVVDPHFRGKGLGRALLKELGGLAHRSGCLRMVSEQPIWPGHTRYLAQSGFVLHRIDLDIRLMVQQNLLSLGRYFPPVLTTERLLLRPLSRADLDGVFKYAHDPEVSRFTLWDPHVTLADSLKFLNEYAFPSYRNGQPDPFGIVLRASPDPMVIGTIGCFWVSPRHHSMELGYALGREHWGKGYTVEAAKAILDYVFSSFQVNRVICRCMIANAASKRVMDKLGFQPEGIRRHEIFKGGVFHDVYSSSLLAKDFLSSRPV